MYVVRARACVRACVCLSVCVHASIHLHACMGKYTEDCMFTAKRYVILSSLLSVVCTLVCSCLEVRKNSHRTHHETTPLSFRIFLY